MKKIQITARTRTPEPITQSVLDKAVELGKALRLADWLEEQYDPTHNQAQAAALLRRLHHNNQVLMNALWKACGDDEEVVNGTIESQGELK